MENRTEKIQAYIDGLLVGDELIQFEKQMMEDAELRQEVNLQKEVQNVIQSRLHSDEEALRANLRNARTASNAQSGRRLYKMYIPIAAAACLLVFFSLFFLNNDSNLYDLPTMQSEIVRGQEENISYENAVKAFNQKSYEEARTMLHTLIVADSSIVQYQYYAALTYFGEEDWHQAIQELTPIAHGKSIFANEAKYYLAASYAKTDQKEKAIQVLHTIPGRGKVGQKVSELLRELR